MVILFIHSMGPWLPAYDGFRFFSRMEFLRAESFRDVSAWLVWHLFPVIAFPRIFSQVSCENWLALACIVAYLDVLVEFVEEAASFEARYMIPVKQHVEIPPLRSQSMVWNPNCRKFNSVSARAIHPMKSPPRWSCRICLGERHAHDGLV